MRRSPAQKLDPRIYRKIAGHAEGLDARTVADYFEGQRSPQAATAAVIRRALAKLNIPDPRAKEAQP